MSETTTGSTTTNEAPTGQAAPAGPPDGIAQPSPLVVGAAADLRRQLAEVQAESERWQAMARKHEDRSKSNADAAKQLEATKAELEQFRQASMSEQEKALAKAVKEAEARVRTETLGAVGQRLVRAEFRAAAAGQIPDLDSVLDDLNLAKFVGPDGEPDSKAIAAAVKRLTPPPPPAEPATTAPPPAPRPDLTQGTRQTMPLNGDPILDKVKAKLGIA